MTFAAKGLLTSVALKKFSEFGPNEIRELHSVSAVKILFGVIKKNLLFYFLFAAVLISIAIGKHLTAATISIVILIVIGVSFIQEYRAERAVKALKTMIMPVSIVIRDGKEKELPSRELVPGDLVVLRSGERVPADCVVVEETELRVDESILTGESREITKKAPQKGALPKDENVLLMGTFVVFGKGVVEVTHTGMSTRFGKIAGMISTADKAIPLREKVNIISKWMIVGAIIVALLSGLLLLARSHVISEEIIFEILVVIMAIAVSSFPEGLPLVLTSTLAFGAHRMAKQNAIVNRLSVIETIGETTVICSDKTATITTGEMTVKSIVVSDAVVDVSGSGYNSEGGFSLGKKKINPADFPSLKNVLVSSVVCNDAFIERTGTDGDFDIKGSATEGALLVAAAKGGIFKEDLDFKRIEEVPFSSERKFMAVMGANTPGVAVTFKGAPDLLLSASGHLMDKGKIVKFSSEKRKYFALECRKLTGMGYRLIAFACSESKKINPVLEKNNLIFLGVIAMEDPPRPEVFESMALCRSAGIKVKMITGDHEDTAVSIAKQIGLVGGIMNGRELDDLSDEELKVRVREVSIFARVRPEHKLRIVRALKASGESVVMTGDGVNDAPALREAHVGVAMGKNGTDVAREAADLTLKDNNFATIVSAVREGRTIFSNIKKFVTYQISCTVAEVIIIFGGLLIGLPLPLLALQILFMNIVTSDLPAITLGFNPHAQDVLKRKPLKHFRILDKQTIVFLAVSALVMAVLTLGVFIGMLELMNADIAHARTMALITLILFEIANAFNYRSLKLRNLEVHVFSNKYLSVASALSVIATIIVVYSPLNVAFEVVPLGIEYWVVGGIVSLSVVLFMDVLKSFWNRRYSRLQSTSYA